jgi:hypothetical protein
VDADFGTMAVYFAVKTAITDDYSLQYSLT